MSDSEPVQPAQIDANTFIEVLESSFAGDYVMLKHRIAELICQVNQYKEIIAQLHAELEQQNTPVKVNN